MLGKAPVVVGERVDESAGVGGRKLDLVGVQLVYLDVVSLEAQEVQQFVLYKVALFVLQSLETFRVVLEGLGSFKNRLCLLIFGQLLVKVNVFSEGQKHLSSEPSLLKLPGAGYLFFKVRQDL